MKLFTQVSELGPNGPLVMYFYAFMQSFELFAILHYLDSIFTRFTDHYLYCKFSVYSFCLTKKSCVTFIYRYLTKLKVNKKRGKKESIYWYIHNSDKFIFNKTLPIIQIGHFVTTTNLCRRLKEIYLFNDQAQQKHWLKPAFMSK